MKHLVATLILFASFSFSMLSCGKDKDADIMKENNNRNPNNQLGGKMKITVGSAVFTATLNDNQAANTFKAMLPLSITMEDLNSNEKFYNFSSTLPTSALAGGNIQVGDLMLYGNNCLVLFYEGFNTSYSYTRLGKLDDISGLSAALGSGSVNVSFELQ